MTALARSMAVVSACLPSAEQIAGSSSQGFRVVSLALICTHTDGVWFPLMLGEETCT